MSGGTIPKNAAQGIEMPVTAGILEESEEYVRRAGEDPIPIFQRLPGFVPVTTTGASTLWVVEENETKIGKRVLRLLTCRGDYNMAKPLSHVIGFDDAPFARTHRGDVLIVGAVFAGTRLDGVVSGKVRRDGANVTRVLVELMRRTRFGRHMQAILLQGVTFAGFNVVDVHALHEALGIPVLVVARRAPNLNAIRSALLHKVRGGRRKWALIEKLGPMEAVEGVFVQRAGLTLREAAELIRRTARYSALPEPLRTAHLIAGGVTEGESRHRA